MLSAQLPELDANHAGRPQASIAALFVQQAARTPDAAALIYRNRRLTYRELDQESNRLARHLRGLGVQAETLVGVILPRSERLVVALLAILKAGGAYVPLDPAYPRERLLHVIADSEMSIVVTSANAGRALPTGPRYLKLVDVDDPSIAVESSIALDSGTAGENLAYVLYTSGSTGAPKGVMVEQRNVINFFYGMDRAIGSAPGVWLAVTSFAFDISVLELLWTLTRGFTVVLHGDDGAAIADEIAEHGVTHLQMTPSLARLLTLDARAFQTLGSLKQILLGGEAVPASLIVRLREALRGELFNMYGPTETTVWSTTFRIHETSFIDEKPKTVPIGRPILNTQIFLLDDALNPVAAGEAGELYIGGDGVARGYWKRPDLTAARFVHLPALSPRPIYRTGDLARLLPDGNLEFLGRTDHQIKLRGHRIETGEIGALLEQCAGVREAVVLLREDKPGDARLVAYMTSDGPVQPAAGRLKAALAEKLPAVMIPSAFEFIDAIPLTQNGKIDRNALLQLRAPSFATDHTPVQPALNDIEALVAAAWQDALGMAAVGRDDNFFDLGAHSLTVAEVQAALQNRLGREIPIVDLYQYTSVRTLAHHLAGTADASDRSVVEARAARRRAARESGPQ